MIGILVPNLNFLGFTWIFFTLMNSRVLISNMKIVFFKIMFKDTPMRYFWSQISSFLVLHETLHFDKFESANFKYGNSFLKLLPRHLNKAILVSSLKIFNFARNFAFCKIRSCFKCDKNSFLKCQPKNTHIR